ncbi:hypothetical protein ACQY1Q_02090 [Tenacibaculum sp. TC6]|uniref:hypothetical protein n=1 Tax=Tenacibaculum sp. TC6 TaxID=3423223 RepID=UPI003D3617C2
MFIVVQKYYRGKVVYEANKVKFAQDEESKNELLSTVEITIMEVSPNDSIGVLD